MNNITHGTEGIQTMQEKYPQAYEIFKALTNGNNETNILNGMTYSNKTTIEFFVGQFIKGNKTEETTIIAINEIIGITKAKLKTQSKIPETLDITLEGAEQRFILENFEDGRGANQELYRIKINRIKSVINLPEGEISRDFINDWTGTHLNIKERDVYNTLTLISTIADGINDLKRKGINTEEFERRLNEIKEQYPDAL